MKQIEEIVVYQHCGQKQKFKEVLCCTSLPVFFARISKIISLALGKRQ